MNKVLFLAAVFFAIAAAYAQPQGTRDRDYAEHDVAVPEGQEAVVTAINNTAALAHGHGTWSRVILLANNEQIGDSGQVNGTNARVEPSIHTAGNYHLEARCSNHNANASTCSISVNLRHYDAPR